MSAGERGVDQLRYVPSTGVEAGFWWGELLTDQRPVDAYSLTYDSPALSEEVAILGLPHVNLQVRPMRRWRTGSCGCPMWRRTAR